MKGIDQIKRQVENLSIYNYYSWVIFFRSIWLFVYRLDWGIRTWECVACGHRSRRYKRLFLYNAIIRGCAKCEDAAVYDYVPPSKESRERVGGGGG